MKTNHRRKNKSKGGHDYAHLNFVRRRKAGLAMDHDGGHKGSAKDVREIKAINSRQNRRKLNRINLEE